MLTRQRSLKLLAAILVGAALAGCDKGPESTPPTGAEVTPPPSSPRAADATVGTKVEDATITARVKSKLIADDDLKAREINVDTSNGTVTLRGNVATPEAKERATVLAREVQGVASVDNQLVVTSS